MLKRLFSEIAGKPHKAPEAAGPESPLPVAVPEVDWKDRFASPPISELTILVPFLPTRLGFLDVMLEHLDVAGTRVPIIMSVSHDGNEHAQTQAVVDRHPAQRITLLFHPSTMNFFERLLELARHATSNYVFVHSDDDFVVPPTLASSVRFLDENADYSGCQGRLAFYRPKGSSAVASAQTGATVDDESPAKRIARHCVDFTTTFHAVMRRSSFIEAHELTLRHTDNVIFLQYLSSCALLALGKFKSLDEIYYLRLDNPNGERASLIRGRDKTHWPYLILAENFSSELHKFRTGLSRAIESQGEVIDEVALDDCCLALVRRAFGIMRQGPAPQYKSVQNLALAGTPEHALLQHCAALSRRAMGAPS
jgi:glycosyltransferase domain-containing protein